MTNPPADPRRPLDPESIDRLSALQLAHLLDLNAANQWNPAELPAILRHQLAAPLLPDLLLTPGAELQRLRALVAAEGNDTFLQHLTRPNPSLPLLQAIKEFARTTDTHESHPLQGPGARVLYYAAIAAARLRLDARITQLTDAQLRDGISWALNQPGAEPLIPTLKETLPLTLNP